MSDARMDAHERLKINYNNHLTKGNWLEAAKYVEAMGNADWSTLKSDAAKVSHALRTLHVAIAASEGEREVINGLVQDHIGKFREALSNELKKTRNDLPDGITTQAIAAIQTVVNQGNIVTALEKARAPMIEQMRDQLIAGDHKKALKTINRLLNTFPVGSPEYTRLIHARETIPRKWPSRALRVIVKAFKSAF